MRSPGGVRSSRSSWKAQAHRDLEGKITSWSKGEPGRPSRAKRKKGVVATRDSLVVGEA